MEVRTEMKKVVVLLVAVALMVAMTVPAFASGFTPSVTAKPAPTVVPQTGDDGQQYDAVIRDAEGNTVAYVPSGALIVTPVSESDTADAEIKSRLDTSYQTIQSASSLTELNSQLEQTIKEISPDTSVDDLVVRDLFDVTTVGEYAQYLQEPGDTLTIRFELSGDSALMLAVLTSVDGVTWSIVPDYLITRDGNFVEITLEHLGVFAFLFDNGKLSVDPNGPKSPQTGAASGRSIGWLAAGAAAVFAAVVYFSRKKRVPQKM